MCVCEPFPSLLSSLQMTEKLQDMENEAMSKIVELEKQLMQRNKDLESIRVRPPLTSASTHTIIRVTISIFTLGHINKLYFY